MDKPILKAIIVDDEQKARNVLHMLLHENCPQVEILQQCSNIPEAVAAINKLSPDVVFLDVDMPGYSGLQILDFFNEVNFKIIFVSAFSEYALHAFRISAVDFLLKPIDIDHLVEAVEKVGRAKVTETYNKQLNLIRDSYNRKPLSHVAVSTADTIEFIKIDDIMLLRADRAYTHIVLANGATIIASKYMKEFEDMLAGNGNFFRSHRSYIVNLKMVLRYNKGEGGSIEMQNGNEVPLSKDLKEEFVSRFQ